MTGRSLSHFDVLEKLGEGGMGVVYKARDTKLNRLAALKVLPPGKTADPERRRRFIQEARAASSLSHPSIVTIYEIDQAGSAEPFSVGLRQTITGTDRIRCAWTSNSRQLVCADVTGGLSQLVRRTVPPSTEALAPLAAAGTSTGLPTIARQSSRLTYVNYSQDSNLWRADLKDSITPGPLISSPRQDTQPDYSADGRKIAFISGRSGVNEVWTADADGSNAAQVTTQGAIPTAPRWSPDGRSIAFAKRPGGPEHGRRYRAVCEDRLATRILHYDLSWNPPS